MWNRFCIIAGMEIYREIKGFDNYLVSNYGNVYSYHKNNIMRPGIDSNGYLFVTLVRAHKDHKHCSIHRLVAESFIPNPENKETVNHRDGDKKNNHFMNLEWATYSENERHAWSVGLKQTSSKRLLKISKPVIQLSMEGKEIKRFPSSREAGRVLGIDGSTIAKCCKGNVDNVRGYKFRYP